MSDQTSKDLWATAREHGIRLTAAEQELRSIKEQLANIERQLAAPSN